MQDRGVRKRRMLCGKESRADRVVRLLAHNFIPHNLRASRMRKRICHETGTDVFPAM